MVLPSGLCTVLPIVLRPMVNSVVDGYSLIMTVAGVAARRLRHHTLCRAGNADRSVLPSGLCTDLHIRTMSMRNSVVHILMTAVVAGVPSRRLRLNTMCWAGDADRLVRPPRPFTVLHIRPMPMANFVVHGCMTTVVAGVPVRRRPLITMCRAGNADRLVRPTRPFTVLHIRPIPMGNAVRTPSHMAS